MRCINGSETCTRSLKEHTRCSSCQNSTRRVSKKGKNNYRAHGPCQTHETRTWRRNK